MLRQASLNAVNAAGAYSKGVSLIELVFAVALIAVLAALGAPTFNVWIQNSQVRTVGESVQNGLQIARNEALRRNARVAFTINNDTSWAVAAKIPGADDEAIQSRPARESSSSRIAASLALSDANTPSSATITYNGLGRIQESVYLNQIDVKSSLAGTKDLRLQISAGGQIRLCDPAATSPNPRYCP